MFVPCQDERALPPETVPETGELEGQTPRENLEKDLLEDRGETKTLQSQEPELLKGPGEYSKPWNSAELVTPSTMVAWGWVASITILDGWVEIIVQCQPSLSSTFQCPTVQALSLVA